VTPESSNSKSDRWDRLSDRAIRALIWAARRLPIRARLRLVSWFARRIIAPIAHWHARVDENLSHVWPDTSPARRREIAEGAIDNLSRAFIENYDVPELLARGAEFGATGPGLEAVAQARAEGRPVLFITGHYGSVESGRAALIARGYEVGGLYRPMSNSYFNEHYKKNMHDICEPIFEQGRRGTMGMLKYLKSGGMAVLLFDVFDWNGTEISFLGQPARTVLSAAEIALRTNALLVPYFGVRRPDRYGFDTVFEDPIPHSDPLTMMQDATQRLEARIIADPTQWMWVHRRWKG
jgi:KDO2-lipid IV(A) lauroyltransferase